MALGAEGYTIFNFQESPRRPEAGVILICYRRGAEAQRSQESCLSSHHGQVAQLGSEPKLADCKAHVLTASLQGRCFPDTGSRGTGKWSWPVGNVSSFQGHFSCIMSFYSFNYSTNMCWVCLYAGQSAEGMARSNPKSLPRKSIHSSEVTDPKELSKEGKTGRWI